MSIQLTEAQEKLGNKLLVALAREAQNLTWAELLMLKAAWQGKLAWPELPDSMRESFWRVAFEVTRP